jgi:hypothetical protein
MCTLQSSTKCRNLGCVRARPPGCVIGHYMREHTGSGMMMCVWGCGVDAQLHQHSASSPTACTTRARGLTSLRAAAGTPEADSLAATNSGAAGAHERAGHHGNRAVPATINWHLSGLWHQCSEQHRHGGDAAGQPDQGAARVRPPALPAVCGFRAAWPAAHACCARARRAWRRRRRARPFTHRRLRARSALAARRRGSAACSQHV